MFAVFGGLVLAVPVAMAVGALIMFFLPPGANEANSAGSTFIVILAMFGWLIFWPVNAFVILGIWWWRKHRRERIGKDAFDSGDV